MNKDNILNIGYKAVQQSAKTNMMDKKAVQYWAFHMGFNDLVSWLEDASSREYVTFMNSIDFSEEIEIDTEYLLESGEDEAFREVHELFGEEIKEFRAKNGFSNYLEIPFEKEKFDTLNMGIYEFLLQYVDEHPMHYLFVHSIGTVVKFLNDGHYVISTGTSKEMTKLTGAEWASVSRRSDDFNRENKSKFNAIDEEMRFLALMYQESIT